MTTTQTPAQDVSDAAIAQAFRELAADPANRISCGGAIIWINIRAERLARELQHDASKLACEVAQVVGTKPSAAWQQAYKEIAATPLSEIKGDLYQAVKKRSEEIEAATPQSSAPVVGDELASLYDAASVGFHISESCGPERKFLRITSFPSLDALQAYEDAWTEAMVSVRDARRESALTGRG